MYINNNQADIRLTIGGFPFFDSWATMSGGELSTPGAKTRPGAMGDEVETGGQPTRSAITMTIQWSDTVLAGFKALENAVGWGPCKAQATWLDSRKSPVPNGIITRTGILLSASEPDYDHNGQAVGMLTITIGADQRSA